MKRLVIIIFIVYTSFLNCAAQNKPKDFSNTADSIAIVSREKADFVLKHFETITAPKLLYSIEDKDFYIIIKDKCKYLEYYVSLDSLNKLNKIKVLKKPHKRDRKIRPKAFDMYKYHTQLISNVSDAKFVRGKLTYFVVKDADNIRYGEYSLSAFTLPIPIDGEVYGYLIRRLSEEIAREK